MPDSKSMVALNEMKLTGSIGAPVQRKVRRSPSQDEIVRGILNPDSKPVYRDKKTSLTKKLIQLLNIG